MTRPARRARTATVLDRQQLAPTMVRLRLRAEDLTAEEVAFSDCYIKFVLPRAGSGLTWPFDLAEAQATLPAEQQPVLRAYTIRAFDEATRTMTVDVVTHGDSGVAGPWASTVSPGSPVGFLGPGGAWSPGAHLDHVVLAGDESAAPAIAAGVEALPDGVTATVLLEADHRFDFPERPGVVTTWLLRGDAVHGEPLIEAVRSLQLPEGRIGWFVHGVAEMVRSLRRHLLLGLGVPREDVSISGYWRRGMTDEQWRASKKEFKAQLEADLTTQRRDP